MKTFAIAAALAAGLLAAQTAGAQQLPQGHRGQITKTGYIGCLTRELMMEAIDVAARRDLHRLETMAQTVCTRLDGLRYVVEYDGGGLARIRLEKRGVPSVSVWTLPAAIRP